MEWISRYDDHNANAMCDLINLVLKCTGCGSQVDVHDIEDPDNATSKLTDLQEEYQAQNITDYPLISKARGTTFSRVTMIGFFQSLVESAHASGLLYSDIALIENIQLWVTTMSSSGIRPFRHTATVISLAIASALCGIMKEIVESTASTMRQKEGEQKKKSVNKGRVAALQEKVNDTEKKKDLVEGWLRDVFDTVFIHRYRDVDPKIRVDCAAALGTWIATCPDIFFEGQYLRYLGWVLSDASAPTRAEVVRQLVRLYKNKDNVGRLRAFTERFRPRMVEMATRDAEPTIRASTIELLDMIREVGLLEPDDIDTIGQLIFDSEPRVRKAVAGFFAENISDLFESVVEELGGEDTLDEVVAEVADDDYDNPRIAWLKLKCLAEVLRSYDKDGDGESRYERPQAADYVSAFALESRYAMSARSICEGVPEAKDWEVVAGYLLYDHSSTLAKAATDDSLQIFKLRCQLDEKEESVLLEVLGAAVKLRLTEAIESEADKKGKKTKARKDESREIQESTALHLAQIIPRLLRKFGASPSTSSAVLRLEHILDLEVFQELRRDSREYASLLDDVSKQFLTHADHDVIAEAKTTLLHARGCEDLEEVTDSKLQELWEDTVGTLRQQARTKSPQISSLANTVRRVSDLASISDCVEIFEAEPRTSTKGASKATSTKVYEILLGLIRDYGSEEDSDSATMVSDAMRSLIFYYMWVVRSLKEMIERKESPKDIPNFIAFSATVQGVINSRPKLDNLCVTATGTLLDLHTLFAPLRNLSLPPSKEDLDGSANGAIASLIQEIPRKPQETILACFLALEKNYAQKAKRNLEPPADDDPPDDLESEPEDSSDDDNDDGEELTRRTQYRQHELLLAEKRLCEFTAKIVLALLGQVLDTSGPKKGMLRKRVLRNKGKLGSNFKDVLGYLDEPKTKKSQKAKPKITMKEGTKEKPPEKSNALVTEDDDEDEEEAESPFENDIEQDLRRTSLDVENEEGRAAEEHEGIGGAEELEGDDDIMGD